jgi:hypothetical protein
MFKEIGSEFNITSGFNDITCNNLNNVEKDYHDCMYIRNGREAIGFILDEIDLNTKFAILPSYICESMLEPFLNRGYSVEYFEVDKNFNPNIEEVKKLLNKNPDIIFVIDWFGMNKNQEIVSLVREKCENTKILADFTHSYFNSFSFIKPDFIIVSLRKWFALPDGAIAINCNHNFKNKLKFVNNSFYEKRKEAMLIKTRYLNCRQKNLKIKYRKLFLEAERLLDGGKTIVGISPFSLSLIEKMDFKFMKTRRRENFNALYNLIRNNTYIHPIVNKEMESFECPFSFPILLENERDKLQLYLVQNEVYCPVLWPLPQYVYSKYKIPAYLSKNMLSIPCDQRYSINDMEYVADTINKFWGKN